MATKKEDNRLVNGCNTAFGVSLKVKDLAALMRDGGRKTPLQRKEINEWSQTDNYPDWLPERLIIPLKKRKTQLDAKAKRDEELRLIAEEEKKLQELELQKIAEKIQLQTKVRTVKPTTVTIHLGSTNSGKTYNSLKKLAERGSGTYACPLRMLAREAYTKLSEQVGSDKVGLLTGEESINASAPILCCTPEMAPMEGDTLVLDEAQWAIDPDRGYAWTRLLVGANYDHIEIAASKSAEKFLKNVFAEDEPKIEFHERLTPIEWAGKIDISQIPERSLVVAFSRKAVIAIANRLMEEGRKVGALYGTLPPDARVKQIDNFIAGDTEILVTTDVVGHGINLPADNIVFSQTEKYDGKTHRELLLWEAAQIAGRAGRFQLSEVGRVYSLHGQGDGFDVNVPLVRKASLAAAGDISDAMVIQKGVIRPTLKELGNPEVKDLATALQLWHKMAKKELKKFSADINPMPVENIVSRLGLIISVVASSNQEISLEQAWQLAVMPIDEKNNLFTAVIKDVISDYKYNVEFALNMARANLKYNELELTENAAQTARDALAAVMVFDCFGDLGVMAKAIENEASELIIELMKTAIGNSNLGKCNNCGGPCAPWFNSCNECHSGGGNYSHGMYEDYDETMAAERKVLSNASKKVIRNKNFHVGDVVKCWYGERTGEILKVNKVTVKVRIPNDNNGADRLMEKNISAAHIEDLTKKEISNLKIKEKDFITVTVRGRKYDAIATKIKPGTIFAEYSLTNGQKRQGWFSLTSVEAH